MLLLILLLLAKQRPLTLHPRAVLLSLLSTAAMPIVPMLVATGTSSVAADESESVRESLVDRRDDPAERLAEGSASRLAGPAQAGPTQASPTQASPTPTGPPQGSPTIREGTLIPPTTGKFVIVGRRWSFVPEHASPGRGHGEQATEKSSAGTAIGFPILMVENLLLQRVVEAIRDDTIADRWSVTGRVTEFFGENRLILQTARRADGR